MKRTAEAHKGETTHLRLFLFLTGIVDDACPEKDWIKIDRTFGNLAFPALHPPSGTLALPMNPFGFMMVHLFGAPDPGLLPRRKVQQAGVKSPEVSHFVFLVIKKQ